MLAVSIVMMAVPARRKPFVITQPDGSTMTVLLVGDENAHYLSTLDGTPLVKASNGFYREATLFESQNIKARWSKRAAQRNATRARRTAARRAAGSYTGEKRGLVILVNFTDTKMKSTSTRQAFDDLFNKKGYSEFNHIGSVRDYFLEQSYGKLTIDFDVVGPYTLSHNMKYYGENDEDYDSDLRPATMVIEALRLADGDVDYKNYDWDGNGEVDQVYVIYAGYAESSGAPSNTIWPHEWDLESAAYYGDGTGPLTLDGVKLNTYACSSELVGTTGSTLETIGTAVHEFSHCLGLPDLYDTEEQANFGMDSWSVMCSGTYNGPEEWGEVPAGYTSYERMFAGWLTPTVLDSPAQITALQSIATHPEAYIIYNEKNKNEYYLLENRQLERFDSYLYGHGMLVLHVDYDKTAWEENTVNNEANHQRCTIIPADNQFMSGNYQGQKYATADDLEGDPYPGTKKNTALTDTSRPAATLYNANSDGRKYMGKPIENIVESNAGVISFTFMGGMQIDIPEPKPETAITANGFTANWSAVEGATSYTIQLRYIDNSINIADMRQLKEDFSGFAKYTSDGSQDISAKLDDYMQTAGWQGTKCYTSQSRLKLGTSKATGNLTTPLISAPTTGSITVSFSEQEYNNASGIEIAISVVDGNGKQIATQSVTSAGTTHAVTFSGIDTDYKVQFAPAKRSYFTSIAIYDGEYTDAELDTDDGDGAARVVSYTTDATSYTFTDLDPSMQYSYRICATVETFNSSWTAWTPVSLGADPSDAEDVNGDGTIDTQDVLAIYEAMQNNTSATANPKADVNGDGTIDTQDVLKVYERMQGK